MAARRSKSGSARGTWLRSGLGQASMRLAVKGANLSLASLQMKCRLKHNHCIRSSVCGQPGGACESMLGGRFFYLFLIAFHSLLGMNADARRRHADRTLFEVVIPSSRWLACASP